jgi:GTP-binding protein EngB required for normal cell division
MQSVSDTIPDYILRDDSYKINLPVKSSNLENSHTVNYKIEILKTILIFGKTGAGKSSILNSITNRKLKFFKEGDGNFSETQKIQSVIYRLFDDMNCIFIDSPGLYDSFNKDIENLKSIADYVGKSGFSIILFAHSILEKRIDASFNQTLEALMEIFGENVMGRVYFVFTHLNKINKNKIADRINMIKKEFNETVPNNKNELLFYDYDNLENNFYGLKRIKEILKYNTTHLVPISKEEKEFLTALNGKQKALELQKKFLINQFESDMNKYVLMYNNSKIAIKSEESRLNDELFKYKNKIQKEINKNKIILEKKLTDLKLNKEKEFNEFNIEKIESITNIQKEFTQLGGVCMTDSYTINYDSNLSKSYDLYKQIYSIPEKLRDKLRNINDLIKNEFYSLNRNFKKFKEEKTNEYKVKYQNTNQGLQSFLKDMQVSLNLEKENMEILDEGINEELDEINIELYQFNDDIKKFYMKKKNPLFSVTIHNNSSSYGNLIIINNVFYENIQVLENDRPINSKPRGNSLTKSGVLNEYLKANLVNECQNIETNEKLNFSDEFLVKKEIDEIPRTKFFIKLKENIEKAKSISQNLKELIDSYVIHRCECKWIRYGGAPSCNLCLLQDTKVNSLNGYANYCRIDPYFIYNAICPKTGCDNGGTGGGWCANILPDGTYCYGHLWWHQNKPCSIFQHSCTIIFVIKDDLDLERLLGIICPKGNVPCIIPV